jgi:hypothetical protein
VAIPILWLIAIIGFNAIMNPTISLETLNKPVDYNVISSKQIEEYLSDEIQKNEKLNKYDLAVGSIDMKIDREHRGEVTVIFVEKDNKKPKVIFGYMDTRIGILFKFQDMGRENKLYPGIIRLSEWKIDSTDSVRITEEFFSTIKDFRYDEIWLHSYSDSLVDYSGDEEMWIVYLTDKKNNIRYGTKINPYTGEVLVSTIDQ